MKTENFHVIKINGEYFVYSNMNEMAAPMACETAKIVCEFLNGETLADALSRFSNLQNKINIALKVD